jgi:hypothetical protein
MQDMRYLLAKQIYLKFCYQVTYRGVKIRRSF